MMWTRAGAALGLCLALAGCGRATIEWQRAMSPTGLYVATAAYDAPVLENKDSYVFLESGRLFSRGLIYRSHTRDCLVLHWTGPRALRIDYLSAIAAKMETRWKPLWSNGDPVTITYHHFDASEAMPAMCMKQI